MISRSLSSLLVLLAGLLAAAVWAAPIAATATQQGPIGRELAYLQENDGPLTLEEALAASRQGKFTAGRFAFLNFGIGAPPVWLHFEVANDAAGTVPLRLSLETAWLDRIDVYFLHDDKRVAEYHTGDRQPLASRPVDSRYYVFEHGYAPGITEIFIRVETPDPMMLPVYLMPVAKALAREKQEDYSYGFLYGFLFALLAYNAVLFAGMRAARYLAYAVYLGAFLLMNASYTGHGFRWLWPDHFEWAQWSNPLLIVLYAVSGLVFALFFLDTRTRFPRMHRAVLAYLAAAGALLLASLLKASQIHALLLAFSVALSFPVIMLAMGLWAVRSGQTPAKYFLVAAIAAMIGAAVTALAVWGIIPTNIWTYRAVDMGILVDATLLALALAYQFRRGQEEKLRAEELATLDPLTGISNRRAFHDKAEDLWNMSRRSGRALSLMLFDIDRFKEINDAHGHAAGDAVLVAIARTLGENIRSQDVAARWGGEEFIVLLPETGLAEATALAERLRAAIAGMRLVHGDTSLAVTASFGVAERTVGQADLDALILAADKCLYAAKAGGRNRVSPAPASAEREVLA